MIVFISYSSSNQALIESLILQLGELGHDVQYEAKLIGSRVRWRQVFKTIKACDVFINTVTPETLNSYTNEIEYNFACSLNKHILNVLLKDVNKSQMTEMTTIVDFRPQNPKAQNALAAALKRLPPASPLSETPLHAGDWVTPLADLRRSIEKLDEKPKEQVAIVQNLREFLERRESFEIGLSLLRLLRGHSNLSARAASEIQKISDEMRRVRLLMYKRRRQRMLLSVATIGVSITIAVVLLSRQFSLLRDNLSEMRANAVQQSAFASEIAATDSMFFTDERTLEALPDDSATIVLVDMSNERSSESNALMPALTVTPVISIQPMSTRMSNLSISSSSQEAYIGLAVKNSPDGLQVVSVGASASNAGIQVGDYILSVDLTDVETSEDLLDNLNTRAPLSKVTLRVRGSAGVFSTPMILRADDFAVPATR